MTIREIPPAHREATQRAVLLAGAKTMAKMNVEGIGIARIWDECADAAIATLLALGYRVAPGWVAHVPGEGSWCPDGRDLAWDIEQILNNDSPGTCGRLAKRLREIGWIRDAQPAPTPAANATSAGVDEGMRERVVRAVMCRSLSSFDAADITDRALTAILAHHEIVRRHR